MGDTDDDRYRRSDISRSVHDVSVRRVVYPVCKPNLYAVHTRRRSGKLKATVPVALAVTAGRAVWSSEATYVTAPSRKRPDCKTHAFVL